MSRRENVSCNIEKAKLVGWKELPYEYGQNFLPIRYIEKFKSPKVFYVAVDYKVHRQTKYHINGVNYFLVAAVKQNSEWKIAVTPIVPVKSIIAVGFGFGTDDEKTYDERRLQFVD